MTRFFQYSLLIAFLLSGTITRAQFSLVFSKTSTGATPGYQLVTLTATSGTALNNTWGTGNLSIRIPASAYGAGTASQIINIASPQTPGINWVDAIQGGAPKPFKKSDAPYSGTDDNYIYFVMTNQNSGNAPAFTANQSRPILTFEVPSSWGCMACIEILYADDPFISNFNTTSSFLNNAGYLGGAGNLFVPGANGPLPVKLVAFSGVKEDNRARLMWITATEQSVDHFEVERSLDGKSFTTVVASVRANGNSVAAQDYQAYDNEPVGGDNFYRLKIVDKSGDMTYSAVRMLHFDGAKNNSYTLSPNPATEVVNVKGMSGAAVVRLISMTGQVMSETKTNDAMVAIPVQMLAPGMYYIQVAENNQVVYNERFVKK